MDWIIIAIAGMIFEAIRQSRKSTKTGAPGVPPVRPAPGSGAPTLPGGYVTPSAAAATVQNAGAVQGGERLAGPYQQMAGPLAGPRRQKQGTTRVEQLSARSQSIETRSSAPMSDVAQQFADQRRESDQQFATAARQDWDQSGETLGAEIGAIGGPTEPFRNRSEQLNGLLTGSPLVNAVILAQVLPRRSPRR